MHAMTSYFPSPPLSLFFLLVSYIPLAVLAACVFHYVTVTSILLHSDDLSNLD